MDWADLIGQERECSNPGNRYQEVRNQSCWMPVSTEQQGNWNHDRYACNDFRVYEAILIDNTEAVETREKMSAEACDDRFCSSATGLIEAS